MFCEGASIIQQNKIYHGFQSEVLVNKSSKLFRAGSKFKVGRYHSLKLKEPFNAENFDISMRCVNSGAAMSFENNIDKIYGCLLYTSPSPRDRTRSRMPSSA